MDYAFEQSAKLIWLIGSGVSSVISLLLTAFYVFVTWRIFEKAGEAGWKSLIPFYNSWILHKIIWGEGAYMFFNLIPIYNIIFYIRTQLHMARAYGYETAFGVGLIFLPQIFLAIIAFDSSVYQGPVR